MKQFRTALAVVAIVAFAALASPGIAHAQDVASPPTIHAQDAAHHVGIHPVISVRHANGVVASMWNSDLDFWSQNFTRTLTVIAAPVVYPVAVVAGLFTKPAARCGSNDRAVLLKPQRFDFLDRDAIKPALYHGYIRRRDFNRMT